MVDCEYSSGVESDHDLDLLVEQEVLQAVNMRKEMRRLQKVEEDKQPVVETKEEHGLSKEQVHKVWRATLIDIPDRYDFVIKNIGHT